MKLLSIEKNEMESIGTSIYDSFDDYSAEETYGRNEDDVRSEISLNGLIGFNKVDSETIRLEFNDGEVCRVNVKPSKMDYVLSQIKTNRKAKVTVKCF